MITVLATGVQTTVQDVRGRPGRADLGVGLSGAADRRALALANRLVGNAPDAAGLEITLGGFAATFPTPGVVALAGAPAPLTIDGRAADPYRPVVVTAGAELRLGTPPTGLRTYLAVRGGIAVAPVLGSRATDVVANLGPAVVAEGDELPVGPAPAAPVPVVDLAPPPRSDGVLRVVMGPRDDWFTDPAVLTRSAWRVTDDLNRVGFRLDGPELARADAFADVELPSEGVIRGSVQVPPSGRPTVFLADHPVTGGYPVIGVVVDTDTDVAGQLRPGDTVRFRAVAVEAGRSAPEGRGARRRGVAQTSGR